MPPFEFTAPKSNYVSTIAELMQEPARANSLARAASAQAWSTAGHDIAENIGGMPARIQQANAQDVQNKSAAIDLSEKQRGLTVRTAISDALKETPKLSEDGVSVWDVGAISKRLADLGYGTESGEVVKHLSDINTAFRSEHAAKIAVIQQGARSVMASGNDVTMANLFIQHLVENGTISAKDAKTYTDMFAADPKNVGKVTSALAGEVKPVEVNENAKLVQPITGDVIAQGNPKAPTQASLAAAAAAGDPDAAAALELMKGNPNEAALALKAANGDKPASLALELMRKQRPQPAVARSWAKTPDGQVRMFPDTEIQANGYTRPNDFEISSAMPEEYRDAISRSVRTAAQRGQFTDLMNRQWQSGDLEGLQSTIRQAAVEGENADTKKMVAGRRDALSALADIESMLGQIGDTDILSGSIEDVVRKLGETTDPRLAGVGSRMSQSLFDYRRAMTGVQFSVKESDQYNKLWPSYQNSVPVNKELIDAMRTQMELADRNFWERKLGKAGAELVGAVKKPAAAPPAHLPANASISSRPVAGTPARATGPGAPQAPQAPPATLPQGGSVTSRPVR